MEAFNTTNTILHCVTKADTEYEVFVDTMILACTKLAEKDFGMTVLLFQEVSVSTSMYMLMSHCVYTFV